VVDGNLSMRADARMLALPGKTLIVTAADDSDYADPLLAAGAEVMVLAAGVDKVDLALLMQDLAAREVNELLIEAGATVCGALLEARLVDELVLYLAPHLLGAGARGMFNIPGLESMGERVALDIVDVRAVGRDWRITAKIRY
jgi:diaminohydroxyphosphoribosylaminopyrimidine deaminase/5-amino-6-(5-phosphoribosylamino)uracil reductase